MDFIKSLLFGAIYLLTPNPIDIVHETEILLTQPISAVTDNATLQIDVSSTVSGAGGPSKAFDLAERIYPSGSITATLFPASRGAPVTYTYSGNIFMTRDEVKLVLKPATHVPVGVPFNKIHIKSAVDLKSVKVYWKNVLQP